MKLPTQTVYIDATRFPRPTLPDRAFACDPIVEHQRELEIRRQRREKMRKESRS